MANILVVKDGSNLVPMYGITTQQRALMMQKFAIYDVNADNSKTGPLGPTNSNSAQPTAAGLQPSPGPASSVLSADYTLTAADNGRAFQCSTALTVTLPSTVYLPDGVVIDAPTSGNLSIASDGTTTLNGATTTLTRTAANNPVGVGIRTPRTAGTANVSGS